MRNEKRNYFLIENTVSTEPFNRGFRGSADPSCKYKGATGNSRNELNRYYFYFPTNDLKAGLTHIIRLGESFVVGLFCVGSFVGRG